MNDTRIKDEAFWKKVQEAADNAKSKGQSISQALAAFGVTTSGLNYAATKRFHWYEAKKRSKNNNKNSKFIEFVQADSSPITIERNGIRITVASAQVLKSVLAVLEEK